MLRKAKEGRTMETMKKLYVKYKEILMYLIFGVATTVVNWVVYIICTKALGIGGAELSKLQITICNGIAWFVAVSFAFVTNKLFVFESKSTEKSFLLLEAAKFFGARIFSGFFEILLPGLLMTIGLNQAVFGVEGAIAKAITSVVVIVMNYVLSKLFVFRKKDKKDK